MTSPIRRPHKADTLERGKKLFERDCAGCHGSTGRGDGYKILSPDPANLTAPPTTEKADEDLLKSIHDGKPNMPGWKLLLSKEDLQAGLAYVRTLAK